MINVVHITRGLGGGRGSMLRELYYAINKKYKEQIKQYVYVNGKDFYNKDIYSLNCKTGRIEKFIKEILKLNSVIIFDHKTTGSSTEYYKSIRGRCPIVTICHTYANSSQNAKINNSDFIIPVAKSLMDYLPKYNKWMNDKNTLVINNSVNEDLYENICKKNDSDNNIFRTGRIDSATPRKIIKDWPKWCGDIKLNKKMTHEAMGKIKQKNYSNVNDFNYLGFISDFNEKVSIIKSWDCCLYEIRGKEGVSMGLMECLVCGIPCIISNNPGNVEVIKNGENGFVYKNRDEAKDILYNLSKDESYLRELKNKTKEYFYNNYRSELWVEKYVNIIRKFYTV